MTTARVLSGALLVAAMAAAIAGGLAIGSDGEEALPPPPSIEPLGLDDLQARVIRTASRIEAMKAEASRDPREHEIDEYIGYSMELMEKPRSRNVTAERLVDILSDPKTLQPVRKRCFDALVRGANVLGDIDLATSKKGSKVNPRAQFMRSEVAPLLSNSDAGVRKMAWNLLNEFYPQARNNDKDIEAYSVDDRATWRSAQRAWDRWLKNR